MFRPPPGLEMVNALEPMPCQIPHPWKLLNVADDSHSDSVSEEATMTATTTEESEAPATITEENSMTKIMMYDIPFQVSVNQVIDTVIAHGFNGTFDSVEMPCEKKMRHRNIDSEHKKNMGFAFIDFKTAESAAEFLLVFQEISFPGCSSEKLTCAKPTLCSTSIVPKPPKANRRRKRPHGKTV